MKNKLFKAAMAVMAMTLSFSMFVGCSSDENSSNANPAQTQTEEQFNVSVTDSTGVTTTLTSKPQRIVSMAPNTTEILSAIGVEDKIVGRTIYCNYPESIEAVTAVGDIRNPNVEEIIALEPDLVVGSTHVSDEVINKLRDVGINVVFLDNEENFEGTYEAITSIGELVGEPEKAAEVVADMKQNIEETIEKVNALNKTEKPKVYYMIGYGEYDNTAGGDTFISEIINLAGGENTAQNVMGWETTKEAIAENEPDMIISPSYDGSGITAEDLQNTDFYKDLKAVKEGKVYEIDGDMISRQGPRLDDALEQMAETINPELAQ